MRKYIIAVIFACTYSASYGQTDYKYRYWFDGDESSATIISGQELLTTDIDAGALSDNLHTINLQVKNSEGTWSSPVSRLFLKTPAEAKCVYWFDRSTEKKTLAKTGLSDIDASELSNGFHTIQVQHVGSSPSSVRRGMFVKSVVDGNSAPCTYWFDNSAERYVLDAAGTSLIDVSALTDGFHTIQMQLGGSSPSAVFRDVFIKIPQTKGIDSMTCILFVDSVIYKQEQVATNDGVVKWTVDATGISQGLHKALAMIVTPSGAASNLHESIFYRVATSEELSSLKCFYSVDGGQHYSQAGSNDGYTFHFDIDLSTVSSGLHRLVYFLANDNGLCSNIRSAFFVKTPTGGEGISRYEYWLNENYETKHIVDISERKDPLQIIELLDVDEMPIRSKCFDFEVEDSKRFIYAVNDFHIRFYDAYGRTIEASERYVDTRVKREVTGAFPLTEPEGTIESDRPAEDSIVWYVFEASAGDSIRLCTDHACTLQIFSPSGDEVYKVDGEQSKLMGTCINNEDGLYYIALHDVTDNDGGYVKLDYIRYTDTISGIENINTDGNGEDSEIVNVYSSDGKMVRSQIRKCEALKDLPAGVYIIKDKKYLVK